MSAKTPITDGLKTNETNLLTINDDNLEFASEVLRAVSHKLRAKILMFINKSKTTNVKKIYNTLGLEQSSTSQHLRDLRLAKIVNHERKGKEIFYSINKEYLSKIIHIINQFSGVKSNSNMIKFDYEGEPFLLSYDSSRKVVLALRAASHDLGKKVISLLTENESMNVTDIRVKLRIEQSVASQQLAILRKAQIINNKRKGKFIYYSLHIEGNNRLATLVNDITSAQN